MGLVMKYQIQFVMHTILELYQSTLHEHIMMKAKKKKHQCSTHTIHGTNKSRIYKSTTRVRIVVYQAWGQIQKYLYLMVFKYFSKVFVFDTGHMHSICI